MEANSVSVNDVISGYICLGVIFISCIIAFVFASKTKRSRILLKSFAEKGTRNKEAISSFIKGIDFWAKDNCVSSEVISGVISEITGIKPLRKPLDYALWGLIDPPNFAMWYAKNVHASDCAREMASLDPILAIQYASEIDQGPHDVTRASMCNFDGARDALVRNHDLATNTVVNLMHSGLKMPEYTALVLGECALYYALNIDKCPHEMTRTAACDHPSTALRYAIEVDQSPNDDTRLASCADANTALQYALEVDKRAHIDTYRAVCCFTVFRKGFFAGKEAVFNEHLVRQYEGLLGKPELN
jgi:hypothetical protein